MKVVYKRDLKMRSEGMTKQERLDDMLMYVQEKKHFHLIDLMEKYNMSNRTAKRDVQALKRCGLKIQSVPGIQGGCTVVDDENIYYVYLKEKEIEMIYSAVLLLEDTTQETNKLDRMRLIKKLRNWIL